MRKGVATAILKSVDQDSIVLFFLILIVCVLFVANSAAAAIRGRRRELGVLACIGWSRSRLFFAALAELAAIGLAAGLLGAALAIPVSAALGLHAPPGRAALAVPVAIAVAVVAGLIPPGWPRGPSRCGGPPAGARPPAGPADSRRSPGWRR